MLNGANARILGTCPIPQKEFGNKRWYARRLANDRTPLPEFAAHQYQGCINAEVKMLDAWMFHERPKRQMVTLADIRARLPKPDWQQVRVRSAAMAEAAHKGVQQFVEATKPRVAAAAKATETGTRQFVTAATPVVISAAKATAKGTQEFLVAATPVVISTVKVSAKIALATAAVAVPLIGMMAVAAISAAATVDPVLTIIVPSDDGGDPTWIEIARWDEEV